MNIIEKTIYVKESPYLSPICYKQGSNAVSLRFNFADFEIPEGATAKVYIAKPSGNATYRPATISGNSVTVDPTTDMFSEEGTSNVIIHITHDTKD